MSMSSINFHKQAMIRVIIKRFIAPNQHSAVYLCSMRCLLIQAIDLEQPDFGMLCVFGFVILHTCTFHFNPFH